MMPDAETRPEEAAPEAHLAETPAPPTRRERRRMEMRERLYEAAIRLLSEREFDAVTVEMITEAADVGKGTFFNYFANKEAIVRYRFETQLRRMTEMLRDHSEDALPDAPGDLSTPPGSGPLWRKLNAVRQRVADNDAHSKRLTRTLLALSITNPAVRAANLSVKQQVLEVLTELIAAGQSSGEFRSDLPAQSLAGFLVALHFSGLMRWAQYDTETTLREIIDPLFMMAWYAVRHQGE